MEWLLRKIERIRQYPESVRVAVLWVSVGVTCLIVGAIWFSLLNFTLPGPAAETKKAESAKNQAALKLFPETMTKEIGGFRANLPSLRRLLQKP